MNQADAIFDAFGRAVELMAQQDKIRAKRREVFDAEQKRCGSCWHWMKSSCKPEKEHRQFKHINSFPCPAFDRTDWDTQRIATLRNELAEMVGPEVDEQ